MAKVKRTVRQKHGLAQLQTKVAAVSPLILKKCMIAIDPSCISASSVPGYAIFRKGELEESGVISGISPRADLSARLQFIAEYIRYNLEDPDVLVVEQIPVVRTGRLNTSLVKAVGAIISSFSCANVIEPLPVVWQKYLDQTHENDYETAKEYRKVMKTDEQDAIEMGRAIIKIARELEG